MSTSRPVLPDSYEGIHNRARSLARAGDTESAITGYRRLTDKLSRLSEKILDRRPELRDLHRQARLELTGLLVSEARYAEAIEVEKVLLETDPDDTDVWRRDLAVLRCSKGEVDAGLADLRAMAEETPNEPRAWIVLGVESRLAGRLSESQAALDRALQACDEEDRDRLADVQYQRFLLFKEMKQLDDATAAWEEAFSQNSEVGRTIRQVYTMLTEAGRYSEAQDYIARDTNGLQAGLQRGLMASLTGRPVDARNAWRQVANLDPDEFEYGHDAWVEAVLRLGDPEPALEWLQEALPKHGTPRLFVLSGIGWAMRQDTELAGVLFQQAIHLQRRERPFRQKIDSADWRLLDALVRDKELKSSLRSYFAVIDTLWG